MQAEADETLAAQGLVSTLTARQSRVRSDALAERLRLEHERLSGTERSVAARLDVQQAEVDQRQALATLRRTQAAELEVRAGMAWVLQQVPVEVGQRVAPGTNLARVADPTRLKAELKIPETQIKDVLPGQKAEIDTRSGVVNGHVVRIDPAAQGGTVTVDVALDEALPRGAQVALGRSSVNTIQIVKGLAVGDRVVLSDMSAWDAYDRICLGPAAVGLIWPLWSRASPRSTPASRWCCTAPTASYASTPIPTSSSSSSSTWCAMPSTPRSKRAAQSRSAGRRTSATSSCTWTTRGLASRARRICSCPSLRRNRMDPGSAWR
jgi:hypothetical protein